LHLQRFKDAAEGREIRERQKQRSNRLRGKRHDVSRVGIALLKSKLKRIEMGKHRRKIGEKRKQIQIKKKILE